MRFFNEKDESVSQQKINSYQSLDKSREVIYDIFTLLAQLVNSDDYDSIVRFTNLIVS
jgi:hypothetical protein